MFSSAGLQNYFQSGLESFDDKLSDMTTAAFNRFRKYTESFSIIRALKGEPEFEDEAKLAELAPDYFDDVHELLEMMYHDPQKLAHRALQYEREESGGVFSPTTEEQRREACVRVFGNFISVAHKQFGFGEDEDAEYFSFRTLLLIVRQIHSRFKEISVYGFFAEAVRDEDEAFSEEDGLRLLTEYFGQPLTRPVPYRQSDTSSDNEWQPEDLPQHIQAGKRWSKLKDVLGQGVLLAGNHELVSRYPQLRLDIPTAVELGTDDEFSQLVELTLPRCSWLKDICSKLDRFVGKVRDFCDSDMTLHGLRDLMEESMETIETVFGARPLLEAASGNARHGGGLVATALSMLIDTLPQRSQLSGQSRAIWDMLVDSLRESMFDLIEKVDTHGVDDVQAIHVSLAEALREASDNFITKYRSSLDEEGVGAQSAVNIMKARLLRATDMFAKSLFSIQRLAESSIDGGGGMNMKAIQVVREDNDWIEAFERVFS